MIATTINVAEQHKLEALAEKSQDVLLNIKAKFPFDFFPNQIIIDANKVDIIYRAFLTRDVFTALIENINSVHISRNGFFATLAFEITGFEKNPEPILFLAVSDATAARRIIMGLIATRKKNINLTEIPTSDLVEKLTDIGEAREDTQGVM
jgi:hypothetical protein